MVGGDHNPHLEDTGVQEACMAVVAEHTWVVADNSLGCSPDREVDTALAVGLDG